MTGNKGLPWERAAEDEDPRGVGIALSGGGLRAASFALGVLQVLQERRGLLFGPSSALYLSAVSGGSYVAAAQTANARALSTRTDPGPAPLAVGSPEEEHILDHGEYLITPRRSTLARAGYLITLNLVAVVVLFIWAGLMIATYAVLGDRYAPGWVPDLLTPGALILTAASIYALVRGLYSAGGPERLVLPLFGFAGLFWAAPQALSGIGATGGVGWGVLTGLGLMLVSVVASQLLAKLHIGGLLAAAANWLQVLATRLALTALLLWTAVDWFDLLGGWLDGDGAWIGLLVMFVVLWTPVVLGKFAGRRTLHREYRERIRSCFGAVRTEDGAAAVPREDLPLAWTFDREAQLFPLLLISATVNVRSRDRQGHGRAFTQFVFGSMASGVPDTDAWAPTASLELGRVPVPGGEEPLLSLFTAVAATGAAVSPSMGRFTMPSVRPVLAVLNLRLGRWIPNLFHDARRELVWAQEEPGSFFAPPRLGPGYDELVPEMLGAHNTDMYITDGGHYDNLGLMVQLRARASEIICVDAGAEPTGAAEELRRVLDLAAYELGCSHDLDLGAFATKPGEPFPTNHVWGRITYADGATATLYVLKLGLTAEAPAALQDRARDDAPFPHHKTTRQWHPRARTEAYRDLGRFATTRLLDDLAARAGAAGR